MTDTLLPPTPDEAPNVDDRPVAVLPGLSGYHPFEPPEHHREIPWALIIGLVLATLLIGAVVGGVILAGSAGAAVAGCGGA